MKKYTEEIALCAIFLRQQNTHREWQFETVSNFIGDWADMAMELYKTYGQFRDELDHLVSPKARSERFDKIGSRLEARGMYEFKLPDGTDSWYVAVSKPCIFRIDYQGVIE